MSLIISNPRTEIDKIVGFLKNIFKKTDKHKAVIGISGGIDSALSLTLLTKAIGGQNIFPVLMPYKDQSIEDAKLACKFNQIPESQIKIINIEPVVKVISQQLDINESEQIRLGNVMARTRMITLFDIAKKLDGLVVGTENKSEHYLGYFTRYGDGASDIEPILGFYKTQVFQLAKFLNIPEQIINKVPSAGLWEGQTDEGQLGFTYRNADLIMEQYIDEKKKAEEIKIKNVSQEVVNQVIGQVESQKFKQKVPYKIEVRY